eukprot:scaffold122935_cov60-Phaeocystis_antarctica.AAC.2
MERLLAALGQGGERATRTQRAEGMRRVGEVERIPASGQGALCGLLRRRHLAGAPGRPSFSLRVYTTRAFQQAGSLLSRIQNFKR